ncbi:MAG TPA: M14 family zinc carboxypeptidase, partial [Blastocatellia bacterium]|nr:M14 family zinc carboxypeptidase [Blastocatellia bacterium]
MINPSGIKAKTKHPNRVAPRSLAIASIILFSLALLLASPLITSLASAYRSLPLRSIAASDASRRAKQAQLKARLASARAGEFEEALATLASLDEPGALGLWQAALKNPNPRFQKEAWDKYRGVQLELARKELIPQVASINAPPDEVLRVANSSGVELTIWKTGAGETVAAAPAFLVERLRGEGHSVNVMYDTVAEWDAARSNGDAFARSITPDYQSDAARETSVVRIAVIDLGSRSKPAPGYSDWLGDRENILMREGSLIAYLDIFSADGSPASVNAHIEDQYARRGYRVVGFYTPEEFSSAAPRLFRGESFDANWGSKAGGSGEFKTLANDRYHSYQQAADEFKALADSHSNIARYVKIGSSYEGRDIFALKIAKNASVDDSSKPDVLITGCHHAREWISVESPIYFAKQLINNYATDTSVKYLVDRLQIWIVPIVNPDGLVFSQAATGGAGTGGDRLWRKNRRPISINNCVSGVGVDLNR